MKAFDDKNEAFSYRETRFLLRQLREQGNILPPDSILPKVCNQLGLEYVTENPPIYTEANRHNKTFFGKMFSWIYELFYRPAVSNLSTKDTARLKQLHRVIQAVERGETDARVSVIGHDEIADVSNSVNTMLDTVVEAILHTTAAEEQLDHAYQQQYQLNQMKDQFIRNVNHELRIPLTQIYSSLQLLMEDDEVLTSEIRSDFLRLATEGCTDLILIVNKIADAARLVTEIESLRLEEIPVVNIVHRVLEQIDHRDHSVYLGVSEMLTVWADPAHLRQVFWDLLSNAFQYSPPGTLVSVTAELRSIDVEEMEISQQIWICVQDEGPGISQSEISFLFHRFTRLERDLYSSTRGAGLGLYMCKQLVEAMGGKIWMESSGIPGEGSRFYFTLPSAHRQVKLPEFSL